MAPALKNKIMESLSSVLPITAIVVLLSFTVAPMPIGTLMLFLIRCVSADRGDGILLIGSGHGHASPGRGNRCGNDQNQKDRKRCGAVPADRHCDHGSGARSSGPGDSGAGPQSGSGTYSGLWCRYNFWWWRCCASYFISRSPVC